MDYHVFTDAARCLLRPGSGGSPYDRDTYRYTPFLAYILLPNALGFPLWGKLLFCAADLAVGLLVLRIARATALLSTRPTAAAEATAATEAEGAADRLARWAAALWLLNPLVANFSTRGSADSLVAALVLATVLFLRHTHTHHHARGTKGITPSPPALAPPQPMLAGVCHGLAVHVKIYPIIFSLAYLAALPPSPPAIAVRPTNSCSVSSSVGAFIRRHVTWPRVAFTLASAGTFFLLTAAAYALHGERFLQEGLLHHLTRTDNRHNFSPWFYPIYLDFEAEGRRRLLGLLAFLPQALLLLAASLLLGPRDLPLCVALQTLLFVAFNKVCMCTNIPIVWPRTPHPHDLKTQTPTQTQVCTAQYFAWYLSVFPAALPTLRRRPSPRIALLLLLLWVGSLGAWLGLAYELEFLGRNTFFRTWLASLAFLTANVALAVAVLYAWAPEDGGRRTKGE